MRSHIVIRVGDSVAITIIACCVRYATAHSDLLRAVFAALGF